MTGDELRIRVVTEMDASRAMLESGQYSEKAGFSETPARMISTAVSELARNILSHAGRGEIRVRIVERRTGRGVEIEAVDKGPGIADVDLAMSDHYSSSGTLGLGLPGVSRLMDEFRIESAPGEGTRVYARKWI